MAKKSIRDIEVRGRRVLVRVDFNVPLDPGGKIADDTRIRASLPTVEYLLDQGAAVILMSHLGRPKGRRVAELSLRPVAQRLGELLGREVRLAPGCVGNEVEKMAQALRPGQVLLLENLRYHPEEEANDADFARQLGRLGHVYVNDAFGAAHRAHASTEGIARHVAQAVSGLLMEKEITYLDEALKNPQRPLVAILGGAKISGKIEVIENLLDKVDALVIGGGMAYTFFKAMGLEIGASLLEEDCVAVARQVLDRAAAKGVELVLPVDCVVADRFAAEAQTRVVGRQEIPQGWQGLDIGPRTRGLFAEKVAQSRTVIWNGPLGVFELEPFAQGTLEVAQALARATAGGTISIIGGGDTAAAIAQAGLSQRMTHISTGGGASLECLGGRVLPGVAVLEEKEG
jgi:phosphoglycerate kinase